MKNEKKTVNEYHDYNQCTLKHLQDQQHFQLPFVNLVDPFDQVDLLQSHLPRRRRLHRPLLHLHLHLHFLYLSYDFRCWEKKKNQK